MEGVEGVGASDPVERKVFVGVGTWFKEISYNTGAKGAHKDLNIKAAPTSFWIILYKDESGDVMGGPGFRGSSKGGG